jgi:hypothetical protein
MAKVKIVLDQPRVLNGIPYKKGQLLLEGTCPIPISPDKFKLALFNSRISVEFSEDQKGSKYPEGHKPAPEANKNGEQTQK